MGAKAYGETTSDKEVASRVGAIVRDRMFPHRIVALICEKKPTLDPRSMILKRTALKAAAAQAGVAICAYVIDVLPWRPDEVYAQPVRDLVQWARSGRLDAILVGGLDDLSSDRDAALFAAVLLAESGVRVIEAGLPGPHPAASHSGPRGRGVRSMAVTASRAAAR